MKTRNIFLSLILLISSNLFAQKLVSENEINSQKFGKEIRYKKDKKTLNGYYKIADSRGNYIDVHFKKGKKVGTQTDYDYKERKLSEKSYKDGKLHGNYIRYYQNGKIKLQGEYTNGNKNGKWQSFDENGTVTSEELYENGNKEGKWWKKVRGNITIEIYKNDIPTGVWTTKNENGQLLTEITHKDKGTYIQKSFYDTNGKLEEQKSFKNFKLDGEQLQYNIAGILRKKEIYKDGVLEKLESFFENGLPYKQENYRNGKLHGKYLEKTSEGHNCLEMNFLNGSKEGVFKQYSYDGWLKYEETYKDNTENGQFREYYKNGQIKREGNNLNGLKEGIWKRYDETGKLTEEEHYEKDNRIDSYKKL